MKLCDLAMKVHLHVACCHPHLISQSLHLFLRFSQGWILKGLYCILSASASWVIALFLLLYQMKHSKSIFSKESLYLQKMKQQVRNTNLENARQAIRQLASFITLVDQIISVHLVDVLRSSIRRFENNYVIAT